MDITRDIRPLTEFKRDSARLIAQMRETGQPQILTVNGRPAIVMMDAAAWQSLQDQLEQAQTRVAIREGLDQALMGQGQSVDAVFDALSSEG